LQIRLRLSSTRRVALTRAGGPLKAVVLRYEKSEFEPSVGLLLFLRPGGSDLLDFFRPFNLAAAFVTVFFLEEYFSLAVFAEEPLLFLEFLSYRDTLGPHGRPSVFWLS